MIARLNSAGLAVPLGLLLLSAGAPAHGKVGFRQVTFTHPVAVQCGTSTEVRLHSNFTLDETHSVFFAKPGLKMTFLETEPIEAPRRGRGSKGTPFRFQVEAPQDQRPGVYEYRVATNYAVSSVAQLMVTEFPVVEEDPQADNGSPDTAQALELPVAACGICEKFEDVDCYRFSAAAGQQVTAEIFAQRVTDRIHGMVVRGPRIYLMDPILTLTGPNGQVVAQNDNFYGGDSLIACTIPADGEYTLEVRDARYAGDPRYAYCVEISERPYAFSLFPMAVQQGQETEVEIVGHGLGEMTPTTVSAADLPLGWTRVRVETPVGLTNPTPLLVSSRPQVVEREGNDTADQAQAITLPVGVSGRLAAADDVDYYRFAAEKGRHYSFEVGSRRQGAPLDSILELYDSAGKRLTDADDIDSLKTKDSRLLWKAPEDGEFVVSLRDLHDRGGKRYVYHLRAEAAEPDFELRGEYYYAMLSPGVRMIWFARVERHNGFEGPVTIEVDGLPPGVTAEPVAIPAGMNHCGIILSAAEDAPLGASLVTVRGRATITTASGQQREIVRQGLITCEQQASGGSQARWPAETQIVGVTKTLDLTRVEASPDEITLKPGDSAELAVKIERVEGFTDAVTLAMSFDYFKNKLGEQLPPGVTMSPRSKARLAGDTLEGKIILEASDKAPPVQRLPIAVIARVSITFSITTNYASNPVYLTVLPADAEVAQK